MKLTDFLIVIVMATACAACSTTPGDAARRGGHPEAAANLYRQGAEQGDALAAQKLGLLVSDRHLEGYGTAAEWFTKACALGELAGCHDLGVGYEYGQHGLGMNYPEAARFYRKAAEGGYMSSQYNLGSLYANRRIEGDVDGLAWLLIAQATAAKCLPQALCKWVMEDPPGHVTRLKSRMSPAGVQDAERRAGEWMSGKQSRASSASIQ